MNQSRHVFGELTAFEVSLFCGFLYRKNIGGSVIEKTHAIMNSKKFSLFLKVQMECHDRLATKDKEILEVLIEMMARCNIETFVSLMTTMMENLEGIKDDDELPDGSYLEVANNIKNLYDIVHNIHNRLFDIEFDSETIRIICCCHRL